MQRLIDADALIDAYCNGCTHYRDKICRSAQRCDFESFCNEYINTMPTIDAEPVRHGKWKWLSCTYDRVPKEKEYECSECHHKTIVHGDDMPWEKYCPNCGADMRGENDD